MTTLLERPTILAVGKPPLTSELDDPAPEGETDEALPEGEGG
jgi:hypothetical protein